jgi:hypothetical protein
MKRFYPILLVATMFVGVSCQIEEASREQRPSGSKAVEIQISTSSQSGTTRVPLDGEETEFGNADENSVSTLDVLVFNAADQYLYRRAAYRLSSGTNNFRVLMEPADGLLTVHLFANCRDILTAWEADAGIIRDDQPWATIHKQLIDRNPARLVNQTAYQYLPMHGSLTGQRFDPEASPSQWGPVEMRRAVASTDVYIEQNAKTADFQLTDLFAYYAADQGFLGSIAIDESADPVQYQTPQDLTDGPKGMRTSLNAVEKAEGIAPVMHANRVRRYVVGEDTSGETVYEAIDYQMYFYDNPYVSTVGQVAGEPKRPTRIIIGGKYKTSAEPLPNGTWEKFYYPVDLVYATGKYRPVIRNWKYEFKITGVTGPGYPTLDEAAKGATGHLNVDIVEWNKDDVQVGVKGHYYVTMKNKEVYLTRYRDDMRTMNLTYAVEDDNPADFVMNFLNASNGTQVTTPSASLPAGATAEIRNDCFQVVMKQTPGTGGGALLFEVTALRAYDPDHCKDVLVVEFRDLKFTLDIMQLNESDLDWEDGGEYPKDL